MDDIERLEHRLKLHDMRVLIAVVEAGSMHKAARRLRTSQPAISRVIADLEHLVGVRLLERSPRGIQPTQYGRVFVKRAVTAFDELKQGMKDIKFLADPSIGELRIGCSEAMAGGPVLAVIEELTRQHPRLAFHVATGPAATLLRKLTERTVELVITRSTEAIANEQTYVAGLFEDNVVVVGSVQSPWGRRRKIKLSELVNEPWVLPAEGSAVGAIIREAFRARGLAPPAATVVMESATVRGRLAATGRFLTVLPEFSLALPGGPSLRALPVELPGARRTMRIVSLTTRPVSPLAELFIDSMRAVTKPLAKGIASDNTPSRNNKG
jgi:DNA-binding transcriptional LysR family regulator